MTIVDKRDHRPLYRRSRRALILPIFQRAQTGLREEIAYARRVGRHWEWRCPHCSAAAGRPVYHIHARHVPIRLQPLCSEPGSPKMPGVLLREPPITPDDARRRIERTLYRAQPRMSGDEIANLAEDLLDALFGRERLGRRPMRGPSPFDRMNL